MSKKQLSETQKKLLQAGKEEFLEKGYKSSSLRTIVKKAGFTLGAFYGYYQDKESLFEAIVGETARELRRRFIEVQDNFTQLDSQEQIDLMSDYTQNGLSNLIDFIYDNFAEVKLLICKANGTRYQEFIEQFAEIEEEYTHHFIDCLKANNYSVNEIPDDLIHILCHSYFSGIFELITHNIEKESAKNYLMVLHEFSNKGWYHILGLTK